MTRRLMTFVLLGTLMLLAPGLLFGAEGHEISEPFDNGWIDWSNGTVWADGIYAPKERGSVPPRLKRGSTTSTGLFVKPRPTSLPS